MSQETQSHLSLEENAVVSRKLTSHLRRRDALIVEKRETATDFTKRIKEEDGVILELAEQIDGTAVQPSLPGTHMDVDESPVQSGPKFLAGDCVCEAFGKSDQGTKWTCPAHGAMWVNLHGQTVSNHEHDEGVGQEAEGAPEGDGAPA